MFSVGTLENTEKDTGKMKNSRNLAIRKNTITILVFCFIFYE